jgi:hemin uptake protein HemP
MIMRSIIIININHRSTEMDKLCIVSLTVPVIKREKHKLSVVTRNPILYSEALFEHGEEVLIQHHDEQYSLCRTSNDKLILTK